MLLKYMVDKPEDFVISTGETHTVQALVEIAFGHAELNWRDYVVIDPKFVRPAEVDLLLGDCTIAKTKLGWKLEVGFEEMIRLMVENDLRLNRQAKLVGA
ncbi:hypothetical protein KCTCHS21_50820 [Cohnella abietis]|uniref:GDP-mannose 4,6-dehydratase n=1 Tax=Cohnella abietis TaxID=2507935 RepID=A0A3T1DC49_9BACL|nr:hypothetical protein KCTCHS21_50820 [Cohnella abietis]